MDEKTRDALLLAVAEALLNMDARHLWQQKLYDLYRLGCRETAHPQEAR